MNTNWDLSRIYDSRESFDLDLEKAKKEIDQIKDYGKDFKGNFGDLVRTYAEASELVGKLYTFANMTRDEDSTQKAGQELALITDSLMADFNSKTSFLRPSILSLTEEELKTLIEENDLGEFEKFLKLIFRFKDHTLSEESEFILGSMSQAVTAPANAYYMLTNADMTYPNMETKGGQELTDANYTNYLKDKDVEVRKEAFNHMYDEYGSLSNTISSLYADNVNNLVTQAKLRDYDSALQMELYEDDVDVKVYENLIKSVRDNLTYIHDYYKTKKRMLGLEEQHMYDVYMEAGSSVEKKIPYEEAVEIIKEAVKPLGDEYVSVLSKAFDERWIDVYPRKGKKGGAYSWGVYSSDPYILMNYTDDLNSLFTLIHELGHSMHSYFSNKNNPYIYSGYTIFVAEVASTTNEILLLSYLMDRAESEEEKIYLINHYLDSFKSTVFRQTMFAEFEKFAHESVEVGEVLTLDKMNDYYFGLNKDYFGDGVVVDDKIKLEWARIPHFYRNFYVYKYATGFLSAVVLAENILRNNGAEAYLAFLRDGGNNFPIDQLKNAGADILDPKTFEKGFKVFRDLVKDLEDLTK